MTCPICAGNANEMTVNGDTERRYFCVNGCGYQWGEPFEDDGAAWERDEQEAE